MLKVGIVVLYIYAIARVLMFVWNDGFSSHHLFSLSIWRLHVPANMTVVKSPSHCKYSTNHTYLSLITYSTFDKHNFYMITIIYNLFRIALSALTPTKYRVILGLLCMYTRHIRFNARPDKLLSTVS